MDQMTYDLLEGTIQSKLEQIEDLKLDTKEGQEALKNVTALTELLITADKDSWDYHDKEERRRIEEKKNDAAAEIERDKSTLSWKRISFEMAKVVVPTVISLVGYDIFQKRVLKFEETGRISSTAGRELHLPRIFK